MKIGRNAPCPCGSGKKYKKCCLKKETEQKAEELREKQAEEGFWDNFNRASYTDKISICRDNLESQSPDPAVVFDMFTMIEKEAQKKGEFDTVPELVRLIEEKCPEIYKEDAAYYALAMIENMALMGDFTDLPRALEPFAEEPDDIDLFFRVIELLMYHNRTDALIGAMERAYPKVRASSEIIPPGKGEFSTLLGWQIIFGRMDELDMEAFYPIISKYWDVSWEEFEGVVAPLFPGPPTNWQKEDFAKGDSRAHIQKNLLSLTTEFMAKLHKNGVCYPRALLARNTLIEYILDEHPLGTKKSGPLLLPNRLSLDRHLAGLLNPINNLPHRVTALIEVIPFYLDFLHGEGLIEREEFEKCLESLRPLKEDVIKVFKSAPKGKEVASSIEKGWERYNGHNRKDKVA